jgi:hypothetical protein
VTRHKYAQKLKHEKIQDNWLACFHQPFTGPSGRNFDPCHTFTCPDPNANKHSTIHSHFLCCTWLRPSSVPLRGCTHNTAQPCKAQVKQKMSV